MSTVPLGHDAYKRVYAGETEVMVLNRFFEQDPTNQHEGAALLGRPGTERIMRIGPGKHRAYGTKPGVFNGDLFIVSDNNLYRLGIDGTTLTQITGFVNSASTRPRFGFVAGEGYQHAFLSDGLLLQLYRGGTHATGTLTLTPATPPDIASQVIEVGGTYYSWASNVNPVTPPDGTSAHPFLAALGVDDAASLDNMDALFNFSGTRGTTYSSTLGGPNPKVTSSRPLTTTLLLTARSEFADGNLVTTTIFSGLHLAWTGATLTGGGIHALIGVLVPDGLGIVALATLASFVVATVANTQKFFFIRPGAISIDALDFASAESEPDNVLDAITVADTIWLVGQSTTEVWYATGDNDAPLAPINGRAYARGVVPGTSIKVKDSVLLVGDDRKVYKIGPGVDPISTHGIEERIRTQLRREQGLAP